MALEDAPVVDVLKFDEQEAYNHDRRISSLIRTQLLHLHHAENLVVPAEARTNVNINNLLTERAASEYIEKVTRLLHHYGKTGGSKASKKAKKKTGKKTTRTSGKRDGGHRLSSTKVPKPKRSSRK